MLLLDVDVEAVGDLVEVVLADAADEAVVAQVVLHALHHVAQGAERVDDETWKGGKLKCGNSNLWMVRDP